MFQVGALRAKQGLVIKYAWDKSLVVVKKLSLHQVPDVESEFLVRYEVLVPVYVYFLVCDPPVAWLRFTDRVGHPI